MEQLTLKQLNRKYNDLLNKVALIEHRLELSKKPTKCDPDIEMIVDVVEKVHSLPNGIVYTKTRTGMVPQARYMCLILIANMLDIKRHEICSVFNLSPSAITDSRKAIRPLLETCRQTKSRYDLICNTLKVKDPMNVTPKKQVR